MQLNTLTDTQDLAERLLKLLPEQSLLVLSGKLGAGKTTLTQAIADALESPAIVSSPTYTLIHEYPSPQGLLVHIDAYRLDSPERLLDLGLDDYLERTRLVVVEWGEGLSEYYPDAWLLKIDVHYGETAESDIELNVNSDKTIRNVSLVQNGITVSL